MSSPSQSKPEYGEPRTAGSTPASEQSNQPEAPIFPDSDHPRRSWRGSAPVAREFRPEEAQLIANRRATATDILFPSLGEEEASQAFDERTLRLFLARRRRVCYRQTGTLAPVDEMALSLGVPIPSKGVPEVEFFDPLEDFDSDDVRRAYQVDWGRSIANWLVVMVHIAVKISELDLRRTQAEEDCRQSFLVTLLQLGMPYFFYTSGRAAAFTTERNYLRFIWKKTVRLLLPLVFGYFVAVLPACYMMGQYYSCRGPGETIPDSFVEFVPWHLKKFGSCGVEWLWFLPVLFAVSILYFPAIDWITTFQLVVSPPHFLKQTDQKLRTKLLTKRPRFPKASSQLLSPGGFPSGIWGDNVASSPPPSIAISDQREWTELYDETKGCGPNRYDFWSCLTSRVMIRAHAIFLAWIVVIVAVVVGAGVLLKIPAAPIASMAFLWVGPVVVFTPLMVLARQWNCRDITLVPVLLGSLILAGYRAIVAHHDPRDHIPLQLIAVSFYSAFYYHGAAFQRFSFEIEANEKMVHRRGGRLTLDMAMRPLKVLAWIALGALTVPGLPRYQSYMWIYPCYLEELSAVIYVLGSWVSLTLVDRFISTFLRTEINPAYYKIATSMSMIVYIFHGLYIAAVCRIFVIPSIDKWNPWSFCALQIPAVILMTVFTYYFLIWVPPLGALFGLYDFAKIPKETRHRWKSMRNAFKATQRAQQKSVPPSNENENENDVFLQSRP